MTHEIPFVFDSHGAPLVGRMLLPGVPDGRRWPTVIVTGAWLTVKEQMPRVYAERLAAQGYAAFTFDFAGFGRSGGAPRQLESPTRKIADIEAAARFVKTLSFVDAARVGQLAVCGSAQYALRALAAGPHVQAFASIAGWYHDASSIGVFYGGDPGVQLRLDRARAAFDRFARDGEVVMVPAYADGDDRAGMFFTLDYYGSRARGAVPEWTNQMAEMSWLDWFTFDGLSAADGVTTPCLFVHGDECVLPDNAKAVHARVRGPKQLVWSSGFQTDFYDLPERVELAMRAVTPWFAEHLAR